MFDLPALVGSGRRRTRRLLAAAMLLHYAAATWAIPVAHALLADDRPIRAAHVESQGDKTCKPVHHHLECSGFRLARLLAAPPAPVRIPDGADATALRGPQHLEGRPLPAATSALGSRAPPLV